MQTPSSSQRHTSSDDHRVCGGCHRQRQRLEAPTTLTTATMSDDNKSSCVARLHQCTYCHDTHCVSNEKAIITCDICGDAHCEWCAGSIFQWCITCGRKCCDCQQIRPCSCCRDSFCDSCASANLHECASCGAQLSEEG